MSAGCSQFHLSMGPPMPAAVRVKPFIFPSTSWTLNKTCQPLLFSVGRESATRHSYSIAHGPCWTLHRHVLLFKAVGCSLLQAPPSHGPDRVVLTAPLSSSCWTAAHPFSPG
ncbi:hypothetical protein VIGAN_02176300 [Vigna angularis var. angularis]|uniref:Uncharacterized protein n=1 Tax=Vigna angularis var. angularis TaxID=157739 RepID=A0A0S3RE63_PHAAN|nr:hypothetical protein VIGAN_02176300 [Vigna angularis var. angularis]